MSTPGLRVFAVEDTTAQITWRALPPGAVTLHSGAVHTTVVADGGPGAAVIDGLAPDTRYTLEVRASGGDAGTVRFRTLPASAGPELSRFATISDIHVGDTGFGLVRKLGAPHLREGFPLVCARAAIAEAVAWGAQVLVVKGDLTRSARTVEFEQAAALLRDCPIPVIGVLGNHDVIRKGVDGAALLAAAGLDIGLSVVVTDLPGIRIALLPTAEQGYRGPRLDRAHLDAVAAAAAAQGDGPAWVGIHHYFQPLPFPLTYPSGLPSRLAREVLDTLADANPRTLVSTGHSHRCRLHHRGLTVSEVGATKDYPGVWAGYAVHAGGIRQVVRRIAAPDAIGWNEQTRRAVGGLWQIYSPGTRAQRCFIHRWPG